MHENKDRRKIYQKEHCILGGGGMWLWLSFIRNVD